MVELGSPLYDTLLLSISFFRSRTDYDGFLFQNLTTQLSSRLNKIQMRALRHVMGYQNSTSSMSYWRKRRNRLSLSKFITCVTISSLVHLWWQITSFCLFFVTQYLDTHPRRDKVDSFPLLSYRAVTIYHHMLPYSIYIRLLYVLFFFLRYCLRSLLWSEDIRTDFKALFRKELQHIVCLYMNGSKIPGVPFVRYVSYLATPTCGDIKLWAWSHPMVLRR